MSYYNESNIKLNIVKQKIISSLLVSNYELICLCFARVYTSGAHSNQSWLYSELEGGLALVIDYSRKSARFLLFDLLSLEITFESELYKNFNIFYTCCTDTFQCFEVFGGFIGFSIPDKNASKTMLKCVTSLTDQVINKKVKENKPTNKNEMKNAAKRSLALLKQKLSEEYFFKESLLNEKKIEFDAYQLEKLFDMIQFDHETETFVVQGNSEEIEDLMGKVSSVKYAENSGLKVSDKKAYAMEIYNNMVNSSKVQGVSKVKVDVKTNIKQNIMKELNIPFKETAKVPEKKIETPVTNTSNNPGKPNTTPTPVKNTPNVPSVPAVPKGVPPVPAVPKVPKIPVVNPKPQPKIQTNTDITSTTGDSVSKEEEKQPPKKKEPPKPDLMSELRMKLANRSNMNNTGGTGTSNTTSTGEQNSNSNGLTNNSTIQTTPSEKSSNMKGIIEALSRKMDCETTSTTTPILKDEIKITTKVEVKPVNPQLIPKITQQTPEIKVNPNPNSVIPTTPKPPTGIPAVPKGVPIPPAPKLPFKKVTPQNQPKPSQNTLTLEDEIKRGVKLKKVVTEEKHGIDYLKKKNSISITNSNSTNNTSSQTTTKVEVKGDLFAEMRKVQLKKIQK